MLPKMTLREISGLNMYMYSLLTGVELNKLFCAYTPSASRFDMLCIFGMVFRLGMHTYQMNAASVESSCVSPEQHSERGG